MFYSKDILVRKDNSLGLIWLMATMGSRCNKLSRKEVNGVNIVKTCKDISQPPEPFALRFSSNLMVGIVRVYNQQYNFYYSDVNSMWVRLRRDLAVMQSEQVDLVNPKAKLNVITFDYDLAIEEDIFRPTKIPQDFVLEAARNNSSRELAVEFGWATRSASWNLGDSGSDTQSSHSELLLMPAMDERRRKITLEENSIRHGLQMRPDFGAGLMNDALVTDDSGLFFDENGNFVDTMPDVGFRGFDDISMVPRAPDVSSALGKHPRIEDGRRSAEPGRDDQGLNIDNPFDDNGQVLVAIPDADDDAIVPRKRQRSGEKHQKRVRLVIDEQTMLTREEIYASRDNYIKNQAKLIREREDKEAVVVARVRIQDLLVQPLSVSNFGPDLASFWSTASARTLGDRPEALRDQTEARQENVFDNYTALFLDQGSLADFMEEPPEPEVRRRQTSTDTGGIAVDLGASGIGLDSNGSGSNYGSRQGNHMPWSIDYLHSSADTQSERSTPSSDHIRHDFETIFDPLTGRSTQRQRRISETGRSSLDLRKLMNDPTSRDRRASPRSRSGSRIRESSRPPSRQYADGGGPDSSVDVHDLFMDMGEQYQEQPGETLERAIIERETVNFLEYVRSILRDAKTNSLMFSEVTAAHRRRDVAAAAFYHILTLSTMGRMRPTQAAPYGDVCIELVE